MTNREKVLVAAFLVLVAFTPAIVHSVGSLSIPNTIGAQSGPNIAASLLDANWSAIASYVNAREVALGDLSSRPAAGTSGRWYCATDAGQIPSCAVDDGASWRQVSTATPTGTNLVQNLVGTPGDSGGANLLTQYSVTSTLVQLRDPSTGGIVLARASSTLTNNTATAGPAANGRDRSTAFSDGNRFIHLYYITGPGQALATLSSTCSTTNVGGGSCSVNGGPTLPTGYSHWAYIGAVQWGTTGFTPTEIRGKEACYRFATEVLANGVATTPTAVSLASTIASNALGTQLWGLIDATAAVTAGASISTTNLMGSSPFMMLGSETTGGGSMHQQMGAFWIPNVSQQIFYSVTNASAYLKLRVQCGRYPNGGE